jgi:hypothetical protein
MRAVLADQLRTHVQAECDPIHPPTFDSSYTVNGPITMRSPLSRVGSFSIV